MADNNTSNTPRASGWRDDPSARPDTIARLEKVIELLAVHGFVQTACRQAHCSKETFYDFIRRYADFAAETDEAAERSLSELVATGWACARKALTDPRYIPVLSLALKTKAGWKESHHVDITSGGKPKEPRELSDKELAALIEQTRDLLAEKPES